MCIAFKLTASLNFKASNALHSKRASELGGFCTVHKNCTSASSAADGKSMQDHERRARKVHFEPDTGSSSCTVWVSHISCSCEPRMCRKSYSTVSSTASAASQSASASHFRMCSCTKNRSQPDEERPRAQKRNVWMKYGWEVSQKARRKLNEQLFERPKTAFHRFQGLNFKPVRRWVGGSWPVRPPSNQGLPVTFIVDFRRAFRPPCI